METLDIKKGWYRTAGIQYGWVNMGYLEEGIGINREALLEGGTLTVKVNDCLYSVDCEKALSFIRKFASHKTMPGGTKVGFISRSIMQEIS